MLDVILHEQENVDKAPSAKLKESSLEFTLHVEWDGGGVEELKNPDWRMKGDEPDKHGRISHRDAKVNEVRPHLWIIDSFEKALTYVISFVSFPCGSFESFDHISDIG